MQQQTLFELEPIEPPAEDKAAVQKAEPEQAQKRKASVPAPKAETKKAAAPKSKTASTAQAASAQTAVAEAAATATDLSDITLEQFLCFSLYTANHAMNRVYKPLLQDIGLTYPQYLAMTVLWQKDKILVGDLGERLHLESNTITPLLKRLETMELLTRTRDKKDERQVRIALTRNGKALKAKTAGMAECILKATGLSANEAASLQGLIMKVRDSMLEATAEI